MKHLEALLGNGIGGNYLPDTQTQAPVEEIGGKTTEERFWEDPILFGQIETPEIPASLLPSWLGEYADAVSRNTQTPSGMAVMMALSTVAACLQKRFVVSPFHDDYHEPLSLWTVTVLPPATRKTAVVNAMTSPLSDWEALVASQAKEDVANIETQRAVNLKAIDRMQAEAAKCKDEDERRLLIHEISKLKTETPEEKFLPRLWTGDVTPERLQGLLVEQSERMSLLSDEAGIFEIMAGLYSNGVANSDIFLKAHAGSPVRVDRGTRSARLDSPALTFGLCIQPEVISQLGQGNKKHFRGNGTLARFLYCMPKSNVGLRDVTQRTLIPEAIKTKYKSEIFSLVDKVYLVDEDEPMKPKILGLGKDALSSWLSFSQFIESNQGENKDFESIQDWTGKLPGAALRIAGLCHVVEHGGDSQYINKQTMERALDLCELLIQHAQATFDCIGSDEATADAQYIYKWLVKQKEIYFKRRDCQQALRGRFRKVGRLLRALDVLTERHIISRPDTLPTKKPTIVYHINPKIKMEVSHGMA